MIISTDYQSEGVGQFGSKWESAPGQNCTFSWIIYPHMIEAKYIFLLNILVTLAVWESIHSLYPHIVLKIKWPNDLFVDQHKIGGILIQTGIKGSSLEYAVIGIGINLNQALFDAHIPRAGSLFQKTGQFQEPKEMIGSIATHLQYYYNQVKHSKDIKKVFEQWQDVYQSKLFAYKRPYTFITRYGDTFDGEIQGVDIHGNVLIQKNDGLIYPFEHKSIRFFKD
jgi:BirA family biotin operon repressor/biotin-[acetyl-CoA-carboxylase] ligase